MKSAKLFNNGGSQAIRLPKEFRFEAAEVLISKIGDVVVIVPNDRPWAAMGESLGMFSEDFMRQPSQDILPEKRPSLD